MAACKSLYLILARLRLIVIDMVGTYRLDSDSYLHHILGSILFEFRDARAVPSLWGTCHAAAAQIILTGHSVFSFAAQFRSAYHVAPRF